MMPAMRYFYIPIIAISLLLSAPWAQAEPTQPVQPDVSLLSREQRLDTYFAELRKIRDPDAANAISENIWTEWRDSGSATGNVLMQWADEAASNKRYPAALDFLDQLVGLLPEYAEGWNKRATLHYQMQSFRKSMADINEVLKLEPRHFGALAGMALILEQTGHDSDALAAWEKMLEIYPANRDAQKRVSDLTEKLAGGRT